MKQFSDLAKKISSFHSSKPVEGSPAEEHAESPSMEAHEPDAVPAAHPAKCPGCGHSGIMHDFKAKKPAGKPTAFLPE